MYQTHAVGVTTLDLSNPEPLEPLGEDCLRRELREELDVELEAVGRALAEARMLAATCGGVRVVCVYAPNGRAVGSPFYQARLDWYDRLRPVARGCC